MQLTPYTPADACLQDQVILITGASRGIGRAVALECARLGASVILVAKTLQRLEKVYDEVLALGAPQPALLNIDLEIAGPDDYQKMGEAIKTEFGHLDGLVHNAGRVHSLTPIANTDLKAWTSLFNLHLHAPFLLTQACLPSLKKSRAPSIVFTIDEAAKAYWGGYGVSKFAQIGMLRLLADELEGDRPIQVNGIYPGPVRTSLRTYHYPGIDTPVHRFIIYTR